MKRILDVADIVNLTTAETLEAGELPVETGVKN
jgi:hypothetical protein